jgi:hypothetical protein
MDLWPRVRADLQAWESWRLEQTALTNRSCGAASIRNPGREGLLLITADALVARYPGPVRHQGSF